MTFYYFPQDPVLNWRMCQKNASSRRVCRFGEKGGAFLAYSFRRFHRNLSIVTFLIVLGSLQVSAQIQYHPRYGPPPTAQVSLAGEYEPIAGGFNFITSLATGPDGRIYVTEFRTGRIYALSQNENGEWERELFTRVPLPPSMAQEQGLWHLAFHPRAPFLYVSAVHTTNPASNHQGTWRIVRYELKPDGTAGELEEVLSGFPSAFMHNGAAIGFDPDGRHMFVTLGDVADTSRLDPVRLGLDNIRGVVLRYTADGRVPNDGVIHPDSPVYAYGFRNPYGMAILPDGTMYVTDNGPSCCDKVVRVVPGGDHGWPQYGHGAPQMSQLINDPEKVGPVIHSAGTVPGPTQIIYYEGDRYGEDVRGSLFYGTFHTGGVHRIHFDAAGNVTHEEVLVALPTYLRSEFVDAGGVNALTVGPDGYIYFASLDTVYRLTSVGN